jgi:hypothetical protein
MAERALLILAAFAGAVAITQGIIWLGIVALVAGFASVEFGP